MDLTSLMTGIEEMDIDSRYRVVIITAQRARQLMQGSHPQVSSKFAKEITVALQEALEGRIEYTTGPEARVALREARLKEFIPRPKPLPPSTDIADEIKKDLTQYLNDENAKGVQPESKSSE
jgi:DNA-directed RNA polymerase subunit omega